MKSIFISYNDADRPWAEWIIWQLEEAGYRPVLDTLGKDSRYQDLPELYEKAELIILVLSPDYVKVDLTRSLLDIYARDSTRVLPLRVKPYEPEESLVFKFQNNIAIFNTLKCTLILCHL